MVALSDDARNHLERYLRQVRTALRGHASLDPAEVERDVRSHIDAELSGQPEPIDATSLKNVLERLGTPRTWVPAEDLPVWRRVLSELRSGPEDWRLAYLTFALFILSPFFLVFPMFWPLPLLAIVPSVLMARATLALLAEHDEPVGARRWLILPPLAVVYVPIAAILVAWPMVFIPFTFEPPNNYDRIVATFSGPFWLMASSLVVAALGAWWAILGLVLGRFSAVVRSAFLPFADWFERRHGTRVALAGLVLVSIAGGVLVTCLRRT
jgi:hypothetical protein